MVAQQTSGINYHKQIVYIVWLADYISTCLQTLSHVWLPSKYGMKQTHREAIVHRRYGGIKKKKKAVSKLV